ncbi:MAG: HDIG domain-containing protein [Clostridiales bacterium]|nr:HDIG domain-containing protein [Clostridiales bacterium]
MTLGDRLGRRLSRKAVLAILVLCVFGIVAIAITPKSYDLQVGSVPEENITAPREVEDTAATDALKKRAREAVSPVYSKDGAETVTMQEKIQAYYEEIDQVRNHAFVQLDAVSSQWEAAGQIGPAPTIETVLTEAFYQELNQLMPEQVDNETLHQLLLATDAQWQAAKNQATESSNAAFENGVGEDAVALTRDGVQKQLETLAVPDVCKQMAMKPITKYLNANLLYDEDATEEARDKAENDVTPVVYKKGQVIVKSGEEVTEGQFAVLQTLGMVAGGFNAPLYIGALLVVVLLTAMGVHLIREQDPDIESKTLLMGGICIVFVLLAALLVIRTNPGFVPVCFVAMTMSMVVNAHTGMVLGNLTSALVGVMALVGGATSQVAFAVLLSGMAGSTACAKLADRCKSRVRILGCGLVAGAAGGAVYICMGLLMGNAFLTILQSVLVSMAVALVASMVCLGSTPIWEQGFKILTPMKLMELCNPTNPLLHRLSMEAPGTYHHSIMVGNLAEAAAEAVGADPLLARAAAYYHDVGKLKAPAFYAENQPQDMPNPHDKLTPLESVQIIRNHTIDGERMILEAGIAPEIARIARQHHGTTLMYYFYNKARENDPNTDPSLFRHNGGKPTTREAALIMLADATEAATRAGGAAGDYKRTMEKIIQQRYDDGQLDLVDFTFQDLNTIARAFESVLRGMYHQRIQYPDVRLKRARMEEESSQ